MRRFHYLILLLAFAGCAQATVCNPCGGGKQSDAQITFSARGQDFLIGDYFVYPTAFSMIARYHPSDSILTIYADGGVGAQSASVRMGFVVHMLPYPLPSQYGLPDTGSVLLDLLTIPSESWLDTTEVIPPLSEGGASIAFWSDTNKSGFEKIYSTDSKHIGTLHITHVDAASNAISGTFSFLAIDTTRGGSIADTVHVGSGVISKLRLLF